MVFTTESLGALTKPSGRIDREKGIVYGVRVVNPESGNGRHYPPAVLGRAKATYEGKSVYWGHRKKPDDTDDPTPKFGQLRNVRPASGGGLEADLHYNPKHERAEAFAWACENNPSLYSLSHHAAVRWSPHRDAGGRRVAESILEVASVDIVSEGGTTDGVFESLGEGSMDPNMIAALASQIKDSAALSDFLALLFDALPSGTFTPQTKADVLLQLSDKVDEAAASTESLRRHGKVGVWAADLLDAHFAKESKAKATAKAKELCTAGGLPATAVTDVFLEHVTESLGRSEASAKALIADRKAVATGTPGPRSSTPGSGSGGKSAKELAAASTFD